MKVKSTLKRFCTYCIFITRKNKKYVYCSKNAKHKQRQK